MADMPEPAVVRPFIDDLFLTISSALLKLFEQLIPFVVVSFVFEDEEMTLATWS